RASGKSKLTRSAALPQFSAAKARQFLQIIADQADIELPADARSILDNYRKFLKEAGWESEA
ncbi:DNA-binding protein, partial [Klebsiella pneumoniae]|nr:DNA-binding protein [Klebsiella pneumoniae]